MKTLIVLSTLALVAVQLSWAGPAKRELKPLEIAEMVNNVAEPVAIENVPILAKRQAEQAPVQFTDMTSNVVSQPLKRDVPEVPAEVEKKLEQDGADSCACTG